MNVDEMQTESPSSSSLTTASTCNQVPIEAQIWQQKEKLVQTLAHPEQSNDRTSNNVHEEGADNDKVASEVTSPAIHPILDVENKDEIASDTNIEGHANANIAVGQFDKIERRTIKACNDNCEKGYDSDGELGPFFDAIEDGSSDEESSVDDSVNSNMLGQQNAEMPPIDAPLIDSDYLMPESIDGAQEEANELTVEDVMGMKVAELKGVCRTNKLPVGGNKKDLQDKLKAFIDESKSLKRVEQSSEVPKKVAKEKKKVK